MVECNEEVVGWDEMLVDLDDMMNDVDEVLIVRECRLLDWDEVLDGGSRGVVG